MTDACTSIDASTASSSNPSEPRHGDVGELAPVIRTLGERQCGWCTNHFPIIRRPGRPQIYCTHSCRQRAYERRRGLGVLPPPPDRIVMQPGGPLAHLRHRRSAYEQGHIGFARGKDHALRPFGIVDGSERRLTLCGLLARAVPREFSGWLEDSCKTCDLVSDVRPPGRQVRLSADLAALRSLVDAASIEFSRSEPSRHPQRGADEILTELLLAV